MDYTRYEKPYLIPLYLNCFLDNTIQIIDYPKDILFYITSIYHILISQQVSKVLIACGTFNSMALRNSGDLFAWGDNSYGQLGNGNNNDYSTPQNINFKSISISCGYHSMALN